MLKLSDNLDLPIDFVTERIAFLARTGAGKSGGMRVLFEQMLDAGMFCVFIDPKGDGWGIRAAGDKPGKPVLVIGGDHADIPLESTAGTYLADFLVRERVSTVLDLSDLSTPQMWKFVADLGARMYKLNRDVVHIFIDEADMIAGEKFYDPHCLHAIQLIQNKGRGRGFGMTIATQRPAIINKTVLNASGTLIAMQTIGDDALRVVKSWLGQTGSKATITQILGELPTLQNREAFVYSPQTLGVEPTRIRFASFQTFDSMQTPKPGEARQQPKSIADVDLSAIKAEMSATIEEVKANDPAALKKKIAELQNELKTVRKPVVEQKEVKEIEIFSPKAASELNNLSWQIRNSVGKIEEAIEFVETCLNGIRKTAEQSANLSGSYLDSEFHVKAIERPKPAPSQKPAGIMTNNITDVRLSSKQQKVLDVLLTFEGLGRSSVERSIVGAMIGMSAKGGGFRNYVSALKTLDLVEYVSGSSLSLTDEGRNLAQPSVAVNSLTDLHNAWKVLIKASKQVQMVDLVIQSHPHPVTREELGLEVEMSPAGGGFRNYVSSLKSLGIIEYKAVKMGSEYVPGVCATDLLFPKGLN